jgi:hypothetical protein
MRRAADAAGSGLPRPVERALMRRYGATTAGRMKAAGVMRALVVLLGRHPRAALDMAGAGLLQASRVGVRDLTRRLARYDREAATKPPARPPMTRAELRRFAMCLDRRGKRR